MECVSANSGKHRVVIIGSGFGGLFAAKALSGKDVEVTLISRTGHHLFQPLLYQVATGILSEGDIAPATRASLENRGVEVQLGAMVTEVDGTGIEVKDKDGTVRRIEAMTKVWAAGVAASPLGKMIADQAGAEVDRAGRVHVEEDLTVKGHPEIFLVGDMINLKGYPGVAQLAIQGGRYAAKEILGRLEGKEPQAPFVYKDKGSMATISKYSAVASIGKIKLTGFIAWLAWLAVHLMAMVGFKNRISTLLNWIITFVGNNRNERATTIQQVFARRAFEDLGPDAYPELPRRGHEEQREADEQRHAERDAEGQRDAS